MATLIGDGGHGRDIWEASSLQYAIPYPWRQVHHHDDWDGDDHIIIGINDPKQRAAIAFHLGVQDRKWIHPNAYVGTECKIGQGTHINYGVTMTRTIIGHHTTISPGVTICGDVVIGDRVMVGAGATIINLINIGDDAFIRAGSIVTRDVAAGERY